MSATHNKPIQKGIAKVPMVMQLEAVECGAACLAMIMAYYGKWVSLEKARSDCGVSRDGSSAKNVIKAARNYGLDADGFKSEPEMLRAQGSFPCIIHWNLNHFVVLDGFKGNRAYLNDPAMGTYSVSMEEFDESFTGICIFLEPTENFVADGEQKSMLSFVRKRLQGNKQIFCFVSLITVLLCLLSMIEPAFSRTFVDYILPGNNPSWFLPFIIGISVFCGIELLALIIQSLTFLKLNGKLDAAGNISYMWKVLNLPMNFFSQRMAGDIRCRQDSNASIASTFIGTLAPLFIQGIMLVFYLAIMIRNSWILTIVGVSTVIINAFLSILISKRSLNYTRVQMRDAAKLESTTTSGFELIETIKASGSENEFFEKWAGYQASVYDQSYKYTRDNFLLGNVPGIISSLCNTTVIILGIYLIFLGKFTIGGIMAFQGFMNNFMGPVNSFLSASQTLIQMRTDMERIDDVMEYPSDSIFSNEKNTEETPSVCKLSGNIVLKDVTFGYSSLSEPVIRNFSLEIKPGMKVAIVGSSGCGKSTISKLISGLYKPWSGEILFDGKHHNEIKKSIFTSSLAVVDQDSVMFDGTIADNIKLWDKSIENFEMVLAARDAQIHNDIIQRSEGYQSRMNEGGSNYSGGQCQRIEISRVLAQDPSIIILDEATSALDAQTEYEVVNSIKNRGITSIVIAHRLSTIRDCDLIIVLDHGIQVGCGTHEELLKENPFYQSLIANN